MSASSPAYSVAGPSGTLSKLICFAPEPQSWLERDAFVIEMRLRERVEAVVERLSGVEIEAHHHRVVDRRQVDAGLVEHHPVIFEVVPDFQHRRVFEEGFELAQHQVGRELVRSFRNKSAPLWPTGTWPALLGAVARLTPASLAMMQSMQSVSVSIATKPCAVRFCDPAVELRFVRHCFIF